MPEQPPCQKCMWRTRSHPTWVTGRNDWPWVCTWLAAWAAVTLHLRSQAAQRAGRAGALEAGHLRVPAFAFSARPFFPFLSVLHKKHRMASISREGEPLHKVLLPCTEILGKLQGYISASSKLNISGTVSALRPADTGLRASVPLTLLPSLPFQNKAACKAPTGKSPWPVNTWTGSLSALPPKQGVFQLAVSPFYFFTSLRFLGLKAFPPASKFCCLTCPLVFHSLVTSAWICSVSEQIDTRNLSSVWIYVFA